MAKKLRFGVYGVRLRACLISCIYASGAEVVAICDRQEAVLERQKEYLHGQLGLDT